MTKILIADDKPEVVELVRAILEDELYQVLGACSGEVALKRIREEKPDLVLLDVEMPTMSGFEVLKKLKEDSLTEQIPVIMLTAGIYIITIANAAKKQQRKIEV
jgi:CheY-like chemotaxis protein